jgi:hypothetical protein
MTSNQGPKGEERKVQWTGGPAIAGAPVAYIVVLASVVAVLAYVPIPVSAILGIGGSFPMSQAVYPLVGFILGPWAGALAAGIGRLIGVFLAPHTASTGLLSTVVAMVTAGSAGLLVQRRGRSWVLAVAVFVLAALAYIGRGMTVDVDLALGLQSTWVNLLGIVLWLLPTRLLARDWIGDARPTRLAAGLALGSWIVNTASFIVPNALMYNLLFRWPAAQWRLLTVVSPLEHVFRTVVGTVVGTGVILGLRAIGAVRPRDAGY